MKFTINFKKIIEFLERRATWFIFLALLLISIFSFIHYSQNGLALAYNDARSHLNIGRRVVEGLKPGIAQIGSVWLPLPHVLMVPTIWNDFMWHTGLSGAIQSMISYIATGLLVYQILKKLNVGLLGRLIGVAVFALNLNILYLQSTAMTELLLLATMTTGCYYLIRWYQSDDTLDVVKTAFWIMLSTLIRYDGWFLLFVATLLVFGRTLIKRGLKITEGMTIMFLSLAGLGIFLWLVWNTLIFKDPLYFAFGPFSAHAQQEQLAQAGILDTQHNLPLSIKVYFYALAYNSYTPLTLLAILGGFVLIFDKKLPLPWRIASMSLLAPLFFNILALYLGHSVLFVQGISGDTWFNVRYGTMLIPSIAVFIGYLVHRLAKFRLLLVSLFIFFTFFSFTSKDAVTIDDARFGSSQKNVSEVSNWLKKEAKDNEGYVLISAASHDAIIFSSGLPMIRFIHEGTGAYWESATAAPDRWARWIIMRTYDNNDLTWKAVSKSPGFARYTRVASFPFADIYQLNSEYVEFLNTDQPFKNQK